MNLTVGALAPVRKGRTFVFLLHIRTLGPLVLNGTVRLHSAGHRGAWKGVVPRPLISRGTQSQVKCEDCHPPPSLLPARAH